MSFREHAGGGHAGHGHLHLVHEAGDHIAFIWTFTGTHSGTGNPLCVTGWEEWDLGPDLKVKVSRGWYDAEEYARQVAGA